MHLDLIGGGLVIAAGWLIALALAMLMALAVLGGLLHSVFIGPLIKPAVRIAPTDPHGGNIGLNMTACHKFGDGNRRRLADGCEEGD